MSKRYSIFIFKGQNTTINSQRANKVFGADCPSLAAIKRLFNDFQRGKTSFFDEEKSGRPKEIKQNLTENLAKIVKEERRINTRELSTRLNISKATVHTFLSLLNIRKLCSRFLQNF